MEELMGGINTRLQAAGGSSSRHRLQRFFINHQLTPHERIMIMLKLWTFLVAYALISCQTHVSQAAPSRTSKELMLDGVLLSNDDAQRLFRAIKEILQIDSDDHEQQTAEENSSDRLVSKRCTGLSTCVLGKLSQDIHKLQTYPRTDVGAGTPGKKRSLPEKYDNLRNSFH